MYWVAYHNQTSSYFDDEARMTYMQMHDAVWKGEQGIKTLKISQT